MRPNPLSTSVASSPWLCVMLLEDTVELHWDKKKKNGPFITTSAAQQAGRRAGSATDGLAVASYYRSPWFPHSLTDEPLACHQPLHSLSISQTLPGVTGRHWVADSESN